MNSILSRSEDFCDDIRGVLLSGAFPSSTVYAQALQVRKQLIEDFKEAFTKVDVLISPTLPVMPNNIGEDVVDLNGEKVDLLSNFIRLTGPGSISGLPALSVPCGFNGHLPGGLEMMGPEFSEHTVMNRGYAIQRSNPLQCKRVSVY